MAIMALSDSRQSANDKKEEEEFRVNISSVEHGDDDHNGNQSSSFKVRYSL